MNMRRRNAWILSFAGVVCVVGIFLFVLLENWKYAHIPIEYETKVLGMAIVDDLYFLESKELLETDENPGVIFENVLLPYDALSNTLYLSQSIEKEEWIGELRATEKGWFICALKDSFWNMKNEAISTGHAFEVLLVGPEDYYVMNLVISGMPIISINTEDMERLKNEEEVLGVLSVFNSDVGNEYYEIHQSYMSWRIKGGTSRAYEKKGYALKLLDHKGNKLDTSLLGMRSDNSWKLNALYTDDNKIREMTASQIWEQFCDAYPGNNQEGAHMEYVEVILNNEYMGIYCLVEPVDEDKLQMDYNDVLYKCVGWKVPMNDDFVASIENQLSSVADIRINYPKTISDFTMVWNPLRDYIDKFFVNPQLNYEEALAVVDVRNLSDVFMFLMVVSASDNSYKNMYLAADVSSSGSYVMREIPWDLDYSFGNVYPKEFNSNYSVVYANTALPRLKMERKDEIGTYFLQQWKEYRQTFLKTDNILNLLIDNRNYLVETGAIKREMERWPNLPISSDIDYLLEYQEKRMEWLDDFFVKWATN